MVCTESLIPFTINASRAADVATFYSKNNITNTCVKTAMLLELLRLALVLETPDPNKTDVCKQS